MIQNRKKIWFPQVFFFFFCLQKKIIINQQQDQTARAAKVSISPTTGFLKNDLLDLFAGVEWKLQAYGQAERF